MIPTKWFLQYAIPQKHYQLIIQLTKRNILQRFKGSILGVAWVLITPILMLAVYTFVFKTVLKAKWPGSENANNIEFALQIFSGLLVFNLFAEVLSRAANLIVEQPNMVKKVIFPLPVLAWVNVLSALFFALVNLVVLIIGAWLMRAELSVHILAVPLILVLCLPVLLGLSWGLSALGVYLRDLPQLVTLVLTPLMFLSPIFYPVSALPEVLQKLMILNPLVQPIELLRDTVMSGQWPNWVPGAAYTLVALVIMVLGAAGFHKLKKASPMSSELAFNIDNVSKTYHLYETPQDRLKQMLMRGRRQYFNEFQALKPVSFTLPKGEVLGVVGRNGAGKSTLLQLICGTLAPTTGHIQIQGRIAALLELGAGFNPQFSGRENIYLSASIMGISKQEVAAKIEDIIDFSGVRDFIDQPVSTYSSGMYVRLAFSVATSVEPDILIIDEALSVGDGDFARRSFERIMAMKEQGATILFCSHSLYQVEVLCSQVIWLEKGGLVKMGAPSQIIPEYQAFLDLLANNPEATPSDVGRVVSTEPAQHSESGQYARIIRVTAKTPHQQGDKLDLVSCETDLSLEIHFKSTLIDEVPQAAIVIHNASGQLISSCSAWAAGVQPKIDEEGNAHIQVEFPKLPLLKGTYYVGVLLFCQRGIFLYDEADPVATLQVSQPNQERGVVMLPHTWQAQTQPNTERKTRAIDDIRQPSDRWQVRPAQANDFDQLKVLFQETFKESLHEDHWHWKYKHADSPGYIVLEGDQAVAFSGGAPRAGLAKGEPVTFVQLGDVMVDRRQRGILTKTGPFYRSIYHFAADKIGLDRDYAFAFGFPNKRHLRVGERQNLYVATDRILDVKWAPKAQQDWILTPWQGDEAQKDCVNRLWQVMQPHLKGVLTGVKDSDWFIYRYLEKPQGNYQLFLVSHAGSEAEILGLIALKDHPQGDIVELLDFIAEPKCAPQILAAAQGFAAQQKRHALMAWMTAHVYAWFKDTEESLEATDVFIPGNAHDDPEHLALSKGNWWLMGGDSDFR